MSMGLSTVPHKGVPSPGEIVVYLNADEKEDLINCAKRTYMTGVLAPLHHAMMRLMSSSVRG